MTFDSLEQGHVACKCSFLGQGARSLKGGTGCPQMEPTSAGGCGSFFFGLSGMV